MEQYQNLVRRALRDGNYKQNRTESDTISSFSQHYEIDLSKGFPLLTTKDLSGYRWESLIYELLWYFSGEHHIRNLKEHTKIWNAWADEDWNLPTAYGRFWRRYPVPEDSAQLPGEHWVDKDSPWTEKEEDGTLVVDQIKYVIETLKGNNPERSPNSRRLVVTPWHPANAETSDLPPCHAMFIFNVQGDRLNCHLTQRSADIALGVPFNIAAYSLITKIVAAQTDFRPGTFSHTQVDSHIYCGKNERGKWYAENLSGLQKKIRDAESREKYLEIREWIEENAPEEREGEERYDHVPGLLKQLSREPRERPDMMVPSKSIDEMKYDDFQLENYDPHPGIKFSVAE